MSKENYFKPYYVECECLDLDHVLRVVHDKEDETFSFEFRLCKYPTLEGGNVEWYGLKPGVIGTLKHWKEKMKSYFKNILYAVKGRPHWYCANNIFGSEQATNLVKFLQDNISKK